jgi:ELWxxDGT repeat protein
MVVGQSPTDARVAGDGNEVSLLWSQGTDAAGLWRTDGTLTATAPLFTPTGVFLASLVAFPGHAFSRALVAGGDVTGAWSVDLRTAQPSFLTPAPEVDGLSIGGVYFWVGTFGLYRTDGTAAGTVPLFDRPASRRLARLGDRLIFAGWRPDVGAELFSTTAGPGTVSLIADIEPGRAGSGPLDLTSIGDRVYFSAFTGDGGRELWTSDGTAQGTRRVADLNPGPASSHPSRFAAAGRRVFFVATTQQFGDDLWVIPDPGCRMDLNGSGGADLGDLFDYLDRWFSSDASADWNRIGGVTLQDLFDYLGEWFGGC